MQIKNNTYEQIITKNLFQQYIEEKRKTRQWNIFFKTIFFLFILASITIYNANNKTHKNKNTNHIAIIEINDIISKKNKINSKNVVKTLNEAFYNKKAKAIILKINSPGGSPVQSNIIHNHIKNLRKVNPNKPIYSIIEDIGTSGAYLIAVATEKIYCDPSSIVGSIGVMLSSFGFVELTNKIGIERRLYKSGKNKILIDPFLERNVDEENLIQHNLNIIHKNFIHAVRTNRNENINLKDPELYSGKFWTGKEALDIGLIDDLCDINTISIEKIKINKLVYYKLKPKTFNIIKKMK